MSRWLKEVFDPSLKCARLGHVEQRQEQIVMRRCADDERFWGVVMKAKEHRTICSRCNATLVSPIEVAASGIDSWSATQSIWDEFERNGRYVTRHWTAA